MKRNPLIIEGIIIIVLLIIIFKIPSSTLKVYDSACSFYEHLGTSSSAEESITQESKPIDGATQTIVAAMRGKGGLSSFLAGDYVEPVIPVVKDEDSSGAEDEDGSSSVTDSDSDASSDSSDTDESKEDTQDEKEDEGEKIQSGTLEWTLKDPTKAIDSGKRAITTYPTKLRTTPTMSTDDNVITTLLENKELIVTVASVASPDADAPEWVEVYYEGKIGYICTKYCNIK